MDKDKLIEKLIEVRSEVNDLTAEKKDISARIKDAKDVENKVMRLLKQLMEEQND